MNHKNRTLARLNLDAEMRHYRAAARKNATHGQLTAIRRALNISPGEIARKSGISVAAVYARERSERAGTISLKALSRMAHAMGCKVVYGIVPENGKTLEMLAEERMWSRVLGIPDVSSRNIGKILHEKYGPIN